MTVALREQVNHTPAARYFKLLRGLPLSRGYRFVGLGAKLPRDALYPMPLSTETGSD